MHSRTTPRPMPPLEHRRERRSRACTTWPRVLRGRGRARDRGRRARHDVPGPGSGPRPSSASGISAVRSCPSSILRRFWESGATAFPSASSSPSTAAFARASRSTRSPTSARSHLSPRKRSRSCSRGQRWTTPGSSGSSTSSASTLLWRKHDRRRVRRRSRVSRALSRRGERPARQHGRHPARPRARRRRPRVDQLALSRRPFDQGRSRDARAGHGTRPCARRRGRACESSLGGCFPLTPRRTAAAQHRCSAETRRR